MEAGGSAAGLEAEKAVKLEMLLARDQSYEDNFALLKARQEEARARCLSLYLLFCLLPASLVCCLLLFMCCLLAPLPLLPASLLSVPC